MLEALSYIFLARRKRLVNKAYFLFCSIVCFILFLYPNGKAEWLVFLRETSLPGGSVWRQPGGALEEGYVGGG